MVLRRDVISVLRTLLLFFFYASSILLGLLKLIYCLSFLLLPHTVFCFAFCLIFL